MSDHEIRRERIVEREVPVERVVEREVPARGRRVVVERGDRGGFGWGGPNIAGALIAVLVVVLLILLISGALV